MNPTPFFDKIIAAFVVPQVKKPIPLGAVSDDRSVDALISCPSCGGAQVGLRHLLAECPGTALMVEEAGLAARRGDWVALCSDLFGPCGTPAERAKHVRLVGQIADALCGRPRPGARESDANGGEEDAEGMPRP